MDGKNKQKSNFLHVCLPASNFLPLKFCAKFEVIQFLVGFEDDKIC